MYMLDTNICIFAIRNRPEKTLQQIKSHLQDGLCVSSITLAELLYGVENSSSPGKNVRALMQFLSILEVLPFGESAAVEYGKLRAYLKRQGTPIGPMDLLIAAHAIAEGKTIVTNNVREFARVPVLKVVDWST